jgi:hypothetical protein
MVRSITAVVGGLVGLVMIVMAGTLAATALLVPGGLSAGMSQPPAGAPVPRAYLAANLLFSLLGALAGGWITAKLASSAPGTHVLVLAGIMLAMSIATLVQGAQRGQPGWYPLAIVAIGVTGVLMGGSFVRR